MTNAMSRTTRHMSLTVALQYMQPLTTQSISHFRKDEKSIMPILRLKVASVE